MDSASESDDSKSSCVSQWPGYPGHISHVQSESIESIDGLRDESDILRAEVGTSTYATAKIYRLGGHNSYLPAPENESFVDSEAQT